MLINKFQNGKNSNVISSLPIHDILKTIKEGDSNLQTIHSLRQIGKANNLFDDIKISKLPTYRFNFNFNQKATNNNIKASTGLIYIDVDAQTTITTNEYVMASWKSISETGFGILVKVEGLTLENFSNTYNEVSELLGITTDIGAKKATQQTVLSYDPNLYYNESSLTYQVSKKVSSSSIKEKRERCILLDDTFFNKDTDKLRFNNIDEYFNDDTPYVVFTENKEKICSPFIPRSIEEGNRNSTMFFILSQYALLNESKGEPFLRACANVINKNIHPPLNEGELKGIIGSVIKKREEQTLQPYLNKERRLLFNPNIKMDKKEKQKISGQEMGKIKRGQTEKEIYEVIENWDFETDGKITQKKVATKSGKSIVTIKRYWNNFKDYTVDLNNGNKQNNNSIVELNSEPKIDVIELSEDDLFLAMMKESAAVYADELIEKINQKDEVELDSIDSDYLSEILNHANIKYIQRALIQDEIDNGQISTLQELEERMAY
ncbi:BT4734/BF3469 family protein [Flavobacterium hibernum]|uniref:BT4734-like N-terminal domain-containing protein n=1 Tax=Flavobacterium hibernum TaxID=37752 RepID=A0A0D0EVK5_9FLAO|nr:BT4734/BF3469 family protein [Flavobacterium hibernum]KIO50946.1 hypothetical protein IW18_20365 [Flavobacterium hibernum]OXA85186.1 hypothetical protein B0A73_17705 [Flavobacterium hibernum]STO19563.1 VirE N-terminal domain [Flavobacterium hibernum]